MKKELTLEEIKKIKKNKLKKLEINQIINK